MPPVLHKTRSIAISCPRCEKPFRINPNKVMSTHKKNLKRNPTLKKVNILHHPGCGKLFQILPGIVLGKLTSPKKAKTSAENGRKGGRPPGTTGIPHKRKES